VPKGLRALDIWIGDAAALGQGHGTEIMRQGIAHCFVDPSVTALLVDPMEDNTRAHRFYERLGFRYVETRRFGPDECAVYRLVRPKTTPSP
jgi:aminoglycoside 6'-N-acetyltransferase